MAKKQIIDIQSFQSDLEGFMEQAMGENTFSEDSPLLTGKAGKKAEKKAKRSSSRKSFAGNLDMLLEDALKETVKDKVDNLKTENPSIKRKSKKPLSGLDSLIRKTVESSKIAIEDGPKRRVTVLFEPENLQKLKTIARLEKSFLKDIVNDVVSDFIKDYEQQRGKLGQAG